MAGICKKLSIGLLLATGITQEANAASLNFYSAQAYLHEDRNWVTQTDARYPWLKLGDALSFEVGFHFEEDLQSKEGLIYNDNGFAPTAGLRLGKEGFPLSAFFQYRPTFSRFGAFENDWRIGIVGYHWWTLRSFGKLSLFDETYGESILSTRLDKNLFNTAWSKFGLRNALPLKLYADAFLEGEIKRDRLGLTEENRQTLSTGVRLGRTFSGIGVSLYVKRSFGSYHSGHNSSIREWRGLLSFGGSL